MEKHIGVTCPFTGQNRLRLPDQHNNTIGEVPNNSSIQKFKIWYFHNDLEETLGMTKIVAALFNEGNLLRCSNFAQSLSTEGFLQKRGEWWFMKVLPDRKP